jgi:hypothetical protein
LASVKLGVEPKEHNRVLSVSRHKKKKNLIFLRHQIDTLRTLMGSRMGRWIGWDWRLDHIRDITFCQAEKAALTFLCFLSPVSPRCWLDRLPEAVAHSTLPHYYLLLLHFLWYGMACISLISQLYFNTEFTLFH